MSSLPIPAFAAPRQVLLAAPRGYCAGVERAIDIVEVALATYGPPVYVRKQIVHNLHVVKDLETRGAMSTSATRCPRGDGGVPAHVALSVHAEARERGSGDRRHLPAGHQGPPGRRASSPPTVTTSSSSATRPRVVGTITRAPGRPPGRRRGRGGSRRVADPSGRLPHHPDHLSVDDVRGDRHPRGWRRPRPTTSATPPEPPGCGQDPGPRLSAGAGHRATNSNWSVWSRSVRRLQAHLVRGPAMSRPGSRVSTPSGSALAPAPSGWSTS
jgi:hypothetical protein